MSKILIENYRGFDIEFDSDYEKFQCECEDGNAKESQSFSAVKKYIDDFKKNNQDFKPFFVERNPNSHFGGKSFKIIGVRKDGRFVSEDNDGVKGQISDYDLKDFMIVKPENGVGISKLKELNERAEKLRLGINEERKQIISELNIVTLKEYKASLL